MAPKVSDGELWALHKRLVEDTCFYAEHCLKILDNRKQLVPLKPFPWQVRLEQKIEEQRLAGLPQRVLILKARKLGYSTWMQAKIIQKTTQIPYRTGMVVAQDMKTAGALFDMGKRMHAHLPSRAAMSEMIYGHPNGSVPFSVKPELKGANFSPTGRKFIAFGERSTRLQREGSTGLDSTIEIDTAQVPEAGRGYTPSDLHCCFPGDTPILGDNGRVVRADEIRAGERIVTHTGRSSVVTAVSKKENPHPGHRMVKVSAWLCDPVYLTPGHEVWTERGWVPSGELTLTDRVSMPIRKVTSGRSELTTDAVVSRPQGGGKPRKDGTLPLNEEVGFAVGYYLAEGCIIFNGGRYPSAITFTRDRDEKAYADRACAALAGLVTSRRTDDRPDSRTTHDTVYGASLADLFERQFGHGPMKRLPDWAFDAGEDFLRGVLLGYLSGDGSKTCEPASPTMKATSTRSSLSYQMRDAAAALGYGWARVSVRAAGEHYGRNCATAWTVAWSGEAARRLRADVGLETPPRHRKPYPAKYEIRDGYVWLPLRSLEEAEHEEVYDIAVEDDDHSFRTAHFSISNSEVAWWPNNGKLTGLLNSVPEEDNTFIALETTANGFNHFHKRWVRAEEGVEDPDVGGSYIPFFAAWHEDHRCARPFPDEVARKRFVESMGTGEYGEDEPMLIESYNCTPEQLYWRRITIRERCEDSVELFKQEFPSFPEEAFIGSGTPVFSGILVQRVLKAADDAPEPVRGSVKGMDWQSRRTRSGTVLVPQRSIWVPELESSARPEELLHVWEHPVNRHTQADVSQLEPDHQYVCFLDAARGVTHTTEARDYHAIQVIDHATREQVAEYRSRIDPDEVKIMLLLIARYYNDAWMAIEVTDGIGLSIAVSLARDYRYPKMFRREVAPGARSQRTSDRVGWYTDQATKAMLEETMLEALRDGTHGVRSKRLAREFVTYVEDERGKHNAQDGEHDDLLIAFMGAKHIATLRRPRKPGRGKKPRFDPLTGYLDE